MRFILHLDMNSFYASVEELQNNKYKNKPIIVSGYTKRSVVASANYIARKFGIRAAMPVFMAQKMCPSLFIVTPHFDLYHQYSEKIIDLISTKFTNNIEIGSIDECYIDITNMVNSQYSPTDIATIIQKTIKVNIGLDCSIGIANNKFLAKMASDYQKPRGITTMYKNEISVKLWPQPVENMLWIGKASAALLKKYGINTIGDVANDNNQQLLKKLLDKNWHTHYQHANGIGSDQLDYSQNVPKSISASETFLNNTNDFEEIKIKLKELTCDVIKRLNYHQQKTKTISVCIKTTNFQQLSKSYTLTNCVNDYNSIIVTVMHLFQKYFLHTTLRLIGVTLSNLFENKNLKISSELFDDYQHDINNTNKIYEHEIIEIINKKMAKNILSMAIEKLK